MAAAVVVRIDDHGVIGEAAAVELVEQPTDSGVHRLDHLYERCATRLFNSPPHPSILYGGFLLSAGLENSFEVAAV